jgi:hypothetical protein
LPETILPLDAWFRAFLLTLVCEVPILLFFGRSACPSLPRRASAVLLANVASHPAVWLIFPRLGLGWGLAVLLSEIWAACLETWLYLLVFREGKFRSAALLSLAANATSFGVGTVLGVLGFL